MADDVEDFLSHHGVKGMHWGIRNDRPGGVSRKVNRHAQRDAKEFARAKAFFGEGAGTRRKLIKATVEGKTKRIPGYKKAFDHHLSMQDSSKHASKAVSERNRKDRTQTTKKTGFAVARRLTGEMGNSAAAVAAISAGALYIGSGKGRKHFDKASSFISNHASDINRKRGAAKVQDIINRMK